MRSYNCLTGISDKYGGPGWSEQFHHFAITLEQCAEPKSRLYTDLLPLINSARVELLDNKR